MKEQAVTIKLKPIDWITLVFCVWMLLLLVFGWNRVHNPQTHFISYLTIITAVLAFAWFTEFMREQSKPENCPNNTCRVIRPKVYKVLSFIRSYYPVLLYLYFFESTSATNRVFFTNWLDPFFSGIDKSIFGYLPSLQWGLSFTNPWMREWLYFSYFSYYLMIMGLPVLFYIRRRQAVDEMVFVLSAVFYFCYFIYSWLPVIGGRFIPQAMEITKQAGGVFPSVMAFIYTHSPHLGGAFPSSHVAIALVISLLGLEHFPRTGIVMLFITFFLAIATVFCHYHWFIDTVFGVLTGLVGFFVARSKFRRLSEVKNAS
jgi:membrane-associated phospholipid phosphatase